jgi:hypothetical protein
VWLARTAEDEDQDMISISMMSSESFLQRYVLMVLFYSTSNNDQGWKYTLNFAEPSSHECDWNLLFGGSDKSFIYMGVECNANMQVSKILIGTYSITASLLALLIIS